MISVLMVANIDGVAVIITLFFFIPDQWRCWGTGFFFFCYPSSYQPNNRTFVACWLSSCSDSMRFMFMTVL